MTGRLLAHGLVALVAVLALSAEAHARDVLSLDDGVCCAQPADDPPLVEPAPAVATYGDTMATPAVTSSAASADRAPLLEHGQSPEVLSVAQGLGIVLPAEPSARSRAYVEDPAKPADRRRIVGPRWVRVSNLIAVHVAPGVAHVHPHLC